MVSQAYYFYACLFYIDFTEPFSMCTAEYQFCIAIELTYSPCRENQVSVESWQKRVAAQQHEIFLFCDGPLLWLA